jgi:protein-S-isoprenylcysteine O-methyltransferase Ste14
MVVALWLFWRAHADLGLNWSQTLEVRKGHEVVKTGVYGSIRHPMYAAILLFSLAQGLLLENWLAGWSALVTFAILVLIRMPREEAMMCEFFGQGYRDYMRQTGRLLPRIGGRESKGERAVSRKSPSPACGEGWGEGSSAALIHPKTGRKACLLLLL